ncbi:MAG: NPCBM/NEW2 domain-containing protein [Planctomycetota bacterium]
MGNAALIAFVCLLAPRNQMPEVVVHKFAGRQPAAKLVEIDADFSVKLGQPPIRIAGPELVSLRQVGSAEPGLPQSPYVELTTGDILPLALPLALRLDDDALHAQLAAPVAMADFHVPHAAVARIAFAGAQRPPANRHGDLLILRNGDRLEGKLIGLDDKTGASLMAAGRKETIPLERIAQIAFDPEFQARPRPKSSYADIVLAGGTRLAVAKLTSAGHQLTALSLLGQSFTVPAKSLIALRVRQGMAIYLDEMAPAAYEATPFLDVAWPLATGRTLLSQPLRLGKDVFPLGVGMHSLSKVTYDLPAGSTWFEAKVGADLRAGMHAAVTIDVELDGKPAPGVLQVLKAGDSPASLRVDLKGAKKLTLVTGLGPLGDVQGHALWVDARILKK